jgi:hypothetical protein
VSLAGHPLRLQPAKCGSVLRYCLAPESMEAKAHVVNAKGLCRRPQEVLVNISMDIVVNTALAHWLSKKGALRLG